MSKKVQKVKVLELAAMSYSAYRHNNCNVHRESSFFDKASNTLIKVTPNKLLMQEGNLIVSDNDLAEAASAIDILCQDTMMRVLKGIKVHKFQKMLSDLVIKDGVALRDSGLMAFLPSMAEQIRVRQEKEAELAELAYTSDYLGKVGDKVVINLTVINHRYVQNFGCWAIDGKDEKGNIVSYLTGKEDCTVNGYYTGKIKHIAPSIFHNNARVTNLNFVKASKDTNKN